MKNVMKTTLKYMLIIVLLVLSGTMQAAAIEYKNNYRGVHQPEYQVQTVSTAAPAATFQSTSAYSGQWTPSDPQSTLNSDGSVNGDAYMSENHLPGRSVRRDPGGGPGSSPGTPGGTLDPNTQQPLGDGLMALMLCACAYLIVRATRKEERIG